MAKNIKVDKNKLSYSNKGTVPSKNNEGLSLLTLRQSQEWVKVKPEVWALLSSAVSFLAFINVNNLGS